MSEQSAPYLTGLQRIPALDGVRGIAIILVLVSHAEISSIGAHGELLARLGDLGVKLFFVLSGFLITTLLLQEQERTGRIAYGRFMARRAFRILPPAYMFILAVVVGARIGVITLRPGDTVHALTYTTDFAQPSWWLGHLWSLSIEEQYYVLWPLILGLVRPRIGVYLMFASLAIAAVTRIVVVTQFPGWTENIERSFIIAEDGFGAGGLLATLLPRLSSLPLYDRAIRSWWAPLLLVAAAGLDQLEHHPLVFYGLLQSVIYLVLAVWLHRALVVDDDWLAGLLNMRWLTWIGSISYSLYLWQQPFLAPAELQLVHNFPMALGLSLAFAVGSYHLVERPFLKLRDRIVSSHASVRRLPEPMTAPAGECAQ